MALCDAAALAAVRTWLLTESAPPAGGPTPEALLGAATVQGLCGLLDVRATRAKCPGLPPGLGEALRRAHYVSMARTERQLAAARHTLALLADQGLRALPLKGAALADWLYDSPGERPMDDVDVLALDDWTRSRRALEQGGFVEQARADHARSYLAPSGVVVELHHSITSCPGLFPFDADGVWARRQPQGPGERPSTEDLLIQLCLHAAFQHGLAMRLVQYLDLRRLLERAAPDPARVIDLAGRSHASAAVALALEAAAIVVEAPVPAVLRESLYPAVPAGLRAWLEGLRSTPERLVDPEEPPLLRLRWGLARGRRLELWAGTLDDREPGAARGGLGRARYVAMRLRQLARRRWAPP